MNEITNIQLPGLDCGMCGCRTCEEFRERLTAAPELLRRCIHLSKDRRFAGVASVGADKTGHDVARASSAGGPQISSQTARRTAAACGPCSATAQGGCAARPHAEARPADAFAHPAWHDHLGREFDFYLEHFPEEPGPREIILPHNPMLVRELDIQKGDILLGRPLGMSCGCPITHCGVVMEVDQRTGVMAWCVTGPLEPRKHGAKDLGYYIAEGYEGLVTESRSELKLGMRYFFQPRMCMLQWRHSGLLNYLAQNEDGYQIRVEGLWIG